MSDKITKTVVFEIEPSGDCYNCKSRYNSLCRAFDLKNVFIRRGFEYKNNWKTMPACRDYLSEQKSKVYCNGCKHVAYIKSGFCAGTRNGMSYHVCTLKNNQIIEQPTNCQDRSE